MSDRGIQFGTAPPLSTGAVVAPRTATPAPAMPCPPATIPSLVPLSNRQRLVLRIVQDFIDRHREPPSARLVARQIGIDESTVREHLLAAHRKGWLVTPTPSMPTCRVLS